MENRKAVIVGVFIALGVVIFVIGVFTLGGQQKSFGKDFSVKAIFNDVSGLKKGNDVWFSGVKVGTISDVSFSGISQVTVKMKITTRVQPYIHSNSGAKIGSDGLIGNRIVVIDGGSAQAPVIKNGDTLQAENTPSTDEIMKTLQENNQNLLSITTDFKKLSHNILQGKGTIGALMADSTMGIQLRTSMRNLETATASAARLAQSINQFGKKLNDKDGLASKLLTDTVLFGRIKMATLQLQQASANAATLTANLDKAGSKLNSTDNAVGVLLNDPKGARQMQSMLSNLQQSSVKLNEDLEALQHNFLLRGFFRKKAKAKADSLKK